MAEENTLTKYQAILEMQEGNIVTHDYFSPNEWVKLNASGLYEFEDGVVCNPLTFWMDRTVSGWETGWRIYNQLTNSLNNHNLKSGDQYRTKSFNGDIFITQVFESYFKVKMQHVSGEDYYASCSLSDFNNKMILGEITSLVRS